MALWAGCATISEDQCAKIDWLDLGLKDGRAGFAAERITEHRKACARVKIEPDELRYLQGRKIGIVDYCQPENAFRAGLAGNEYHGICDGSFARNHRAAYGVATLRKEIETNRSAISWREAELRGDKASDARKGNLRSEIRDLDRQRETLRDRLFAAERELERVRNVAPPVVIAAPAPAPSPPPRPQRPMAPVDSPGAASGTFHVGATAAPLHFAYTFVAPDRFERMQPRAMLLLTAHAIPANVLGQSDDLQRVLDDLPYYVLAVRSDAKPPKLALIVKHPQLGVTERIERDAGRSGRARFEAYDAQRIAGSLTSPQDGKSPFAWNKSLRMAVSFDAPLVRRWP